MGWDWDYVCWHVDLPRLRALQKYWRLNPPVHQLVAAYMQYEPKDAQPAAVTSNTEAANDGLAAFMAMVPMRENVKPQG